MNPKFQQMLEKGKLERIRIDEAMIDKEIDGAEYDIEKAKESLENGDFKWATVKAYYSMFHSIRALVFNKGYREKSHYALLIAFKELYAEEKSVDMKYANYFESAMDLRESADYDLTFSKESAEEVIENAEEILERIRNILK